MRASISWLIFVLLSATVFAASAAPPIRIEIPIFEGGEGTEFFLRCAREYEKIRPDVTVDLYGDPRIADKVRVRILEGTFPEATNAQLNYWPLIRNGDIQPLDEFLDGPNWENDTTWRKSFLPGSLDQYTSGGKVYGIPLAYFANVIWYNKAMFEQHGWKPARTWDELFALCEQIKSAGIAPMAFQGRYPYYIQPFTESAYYHLAGRQRYDQQKMIAPGSFDNPECLKDFEWVERLSLHYFQPGSLGMSHTESQLQFFLGNTAMISCGSWLKSEMAGKIPDGFRLGAFNLPIPAESKGDPTALNVFSLYYFVMAHSQHPRQAVDFLRFMTSRRMACEFSRMRDIPTAVRGASKGNLSSDLDDLVTLIDASHSTYGEASGENFPEMDQHLQDAQYQLVSGTATPKQVTLELEANAASVRSHAEHPREVLVRHLGKTIALLGTLFAAFAFWVGMMVSAKRKKQDLRQPEDLSARLSMGWRNVLIFTGPTVVIYTVLFILPCIRSFAWSVHEWNGLTDMKSMPFVGLLNFKRLLLESDGFWIALKNNLFLMLVVPIFIVPLALFLAVCISRGVVGASIFRVAFFFPNLLGGVAITLLWMHLYEGGVLNSILSAIGLKRFDGFAWLSPNHLYWALIPMSVWGACGFYMVLYLAAMQNIPSDLYEAAELDGASPLRQFWQITLPLIWEVLTISMVFLVIGGMKAFEIIWLLTNQRPTTDNHVVGTRMVQTMFSEFKVGEATAIAVILFLLVFVGSAGTLRALRRETVEM